MSDLGTARDHYDVIALGGGAAGLSAARAAMNEGASVALISDSPLGGDCTFTGCVPSKTLIEAARAGRSFGEAMSDVHRVVETIASTENADVLRHEGIDVIEARATLVGGTTLAVEGRRLAADHVMVATGSRTAVPPIEGLSDVNYLTNESLWDLGKKPRTLGVLGGGPIGAELSQALAQLGVSVTVFEMADRVLSREEPEASRVAAAALERTGVTLRLGQPVTRVAAAAGGIRVETAEGPPIEVEQLLVATGRRPNSEGFGLDTAGVEVDRRGHVVTDDDLSTNVDGIWAIGDVNGKMPFTNAADEMGRLAVWTALRTGRRYKFRPEWIPRVTFIDPEIAAVGVSEADAPRGARIAELPMSANDRALTAGRIDGFIKLIVGRRGLLGNIGGGLVLGATIVAPRAGEMIHEPVLAMRTKMFAGRLALTTHAYPSWSMGIQKAAGSLFYEIEGRQARKVRTPSTLNL